jgi:hypothetical protein
MNTPMEGERQESVIKSAAKLFMLGRNPAAASGAIVAFVALVIAASKAGEKGRAYCVN